MYLDVQTPAVLRYAETDAPTEYGLVHAVVYRVGGGETPEEHIALVVGDVGGNAIGDPEMYGGYLLDPKSIFSAFKSDEMAPKIQPLLTETDEPKRLQGYRDAHQFAAERGFTIPLLQTVKTIAYRNEIQVTKYDNGWILPQTYSYKS